MLSSSSAAFLPFDFDFDFSLFDVFDFDLIGSDSLEDRSFFLLFRLFSEELLLDFLTELGKI